MMFQRPENLYHSYQKIIHTSRTTTVSILSRKFVKNPTHPKLLIILTRTITSSILQQQQTIIFFLHYLIPILLRSFVQHLILSKPSRMVNQTHAPLSYKILQITLLLFLLETLVTLKFLSQMKSRNIIKFMTFTVKFTTQGCSYIPS